MVALASTDVTVTVTERRISDKRRIHGVTLAFGDGALTYPAGGVPMPTAARLGMARFLSYINMLDPGSGDGFLYKYDQANNKLRIYQGDNTNAAAAPAVELGAVAVAAKTIKATAVGW